MSDRITLLPPQEYASDRLRESLSAKVREAIEELLQAELDEVLGALRHQRTGERRGYRCLKQPADIEAPPVIFLCFGVDPNGLQRTREFHS